jgi:glutaredoxin
MSAPVHSDETASSGPRPFIGSFLMYAGIAVCVLLVLDSAAGLPFRLPASWYLHRSLWGALGVAAFVTGWMAQRGRNGPDAEWAAGVRGKRFRRLVVYTRAECHLCDDAKDILAHYLDYLPEIEDVDIDRDPELKERFGTTIPVVEIDGQIRFKGRIDEILLRRLIEGTPPVE